MSTSPSQDIEWMEMALAHAINGQGAVEPNPMVGAVIVDANGDHICGAWHAEFGGPHAEVNAFELAGDQAKGGTLYVTLEPCCHQGKTPPCTDAILQAGIKRVVAAMADPFPKVAGGGFDILRKAGIEVVTGVCEEEARNLNAPYLKLLSTGRPWVHLKWAMSLDGKIATRTGDSRWISNDSSRAAVHALRGRVDAVIVGRGTVISDDPLLTARPAGPRVATRVVISTSGQLPTECQLLSTLPDYPVLVFTQESQVKSLSAWTGRGAEVVGLPLQDGRLSIAAILEDLGRRRMTNVLVEGGSGLIGSFLDTRAADEVHVFVAPLLIGGTGAPAPVGGQGISKIAEAYALVDIETEMLEQDQYIRGRIVYE